jgi:hypothetical protein
LSFIDLVALAHQNIKAFSVELYGFQTYMQQQLKPVFCAHAYGMPGSGNVSDNGCARGV